MKLGRFVKVMEKWVFFKLLLQIQQTHLGVRITGGKVHVPLRVHLKFTFEVENRCFRAFT
jgi:hypothetical protein